MKKTYLTFLLCLFGVINYSQTKIKYQILDFSIADTMIRFQVESYNKGFDIFRPIENNLLYKRPTSIDTINNILLHNNTYQLKPIDQVLLNNIDTLPIYYKFQLRIDSSSYQQFPDHEKNEYLEQTINNDLSLTYHLNKLKIKRKNEEILGRLFFNYPLGLGMYVRFFKSKNNIELETILFEVKDYGEYIISNYELIELSKKESKKIENISCILERLECISCPYFSTETIYTSKNRFIFSNQCIREFDTNKNPKELKKSLSYINQLLVKYSHTSSVSINFYNN